jgi:hypothetical protein
MWLVDAFVTKGGQLKSFGHANYASSKYDVIRTTTPHGLLFM